MFKSSKVVAELGKRNVYAVLAAEKGKHINGVGGGGGGGGGGVGTLAVT